MKNDDSKKKYNEEAVLIFKGSLGYQPAKKSKYSKTSTNKFGKAPDFL